MSSPPITGTDILDQLDSHLSGTPLDVVRSLSQQVREAAEPGVPSSYQSGQIWLSELTLPG